MSFSRLLILALCLLLPGCVQMSSRYVHGTEYDRAVILYESGRLAEARYKAGSVSRDDPNYRAARKLLADINAISMRLSTRHMEMAEDYERAGIPRKAAAEYREAVRFNPSNMLARKRLAVLSEAAQDSPEPASVQKAAAQPRKGAKDEPESLAGIHYLKGKGHMESRSWARAIEELTTAVKIAPSYLNAKELLDRARDERDKAVDKHIKKGISYFQGEEMELAIKEWDAVLELDPSNRVAADYKYRAEVIMERLKRIREKQASTEKPI